MTPLLLSTEILKAYTDSAGSRIYSTEEQASLTCTPTSLQGDLARKYLPWGTVTIFPVKRETYLYQGYIIRLYHLVNTAEFVYKASDFFCLGQILSPDGEMMHESWRVRAQRKNNISTIELAQSWVDANKSLHLF